MKLLFISTEPYSKRDDIWQEAMLNEFPGAEFVFWAEETTNLSDFDYAITWKPPIGVLKKCSSLKAILSIAAGVDSVLADPDLPDVPIVRLIDRNLTQGMTEFVLHWILHFHRDFDRCMEWQKQRHWGYLPQCCPEDRKVGIMGLGELGGAAAMHLAQLNFDVAGWSRSRKKIPQVKSFAGTEELIPFLNRTEFLVCLLPLTQETRNIVRKETILQLPKGGVFINAGRGSHMNPTDVLNALDSGHLRAVVLDVFPQEPLQQDSSFWTHPKVIVTPHTASQTTPESAAKFLAKNIRLIEKGESPTHVLNKKREY